MTDVIRWGVLGASKFARNQMAPAIHMADGAVLSALATSDAQKAAPFQAFQSDLKLYSDYDALLADPDIDAVYIPLPNHLHVPWSIKALEAGKHVLTEKPIGLSVDQIDTLIAVRDKTGLVAAEAYMIVHHPQWHRVKSLLDDGAIGTLMHVDGVFTYNNSADTGNIRNKAAMGGGGIPDIGVYTYGATRWATGQEPEDITNADITFENGVDVIARVSARFRGFTATWLNSMRMHPRQEMTFHGDQGWIHLSAPFNPQGYGEARVILRANGHERTETFPAAMQYKLQVEAFGRAIHGEAAFPWSLEDAKGTQSVIDKIFRVAKQPD